MIKNKNILITSLLALSLGLVGCSTSVAKLAVDNEKVVTLDASAKVNPSDYLENVAEGAEVSYTINDGTMTITVTKDDKSETFEVPVEIEEPNVSIDENITIDTYAGYNIEDYIHEDEGVTHTTNFNEETGKLSVTFEKGEWTTTLDSQVEVTSSEPEYRTYSSLYTCNAESFRQTVILYKNGTCYSDFAGYNTWSTDGKNVTITGCGLKAMNITQTGTISEDGKTITFYDPNDCYSAPGVGPFGDTTTFTPIED